MALPGATVTPGATATRGVTAIPGATPPCRAAPASSPRLRNNKQTSPCVTRWVFALLACAVLTAQATTPVPEVRPMYFEHLTMRDGLSQSTVMSILQDSQGFPVARHRERPRSLRRLLHSRVSPRARQQERARERLRVEGCRRRARRSVARDDRRRYRALGSAQRSLPTVPTRSRRSVLSGERCDPHAADRRARVRCGPRQNGTVSTSSIRKPAAHATSTTSKAIRAPSRPMRCSRSTTDRAGRLWVGTDKGLGRYEPEQR